MIESPQAELPLVLPALPPWAAGPVIFSTDERFDPTPGTDWRDAARRLRALIGEAGFPQPDRMVLQRQVHGSRVVDTGKLPGDTESDENLGAVWVPECDGLLTTEPGTALIVRTADCLPIVLWEPGTARLAAVHAGWRGSFENILGEAIAALVVCGVAMGNLHAWVGPRIGGDAYEVSEDLIQQFIERWGGRGVFWSGRKLDLPALNRGLARAAGLASAQYHDSRFCTYSGPKRFPSHRRDGERRGQVFTVAYFPPGERK